MVEGHSVHRIAVAHGTRLVGRKFRAVSPNGRFSDGARLIDGREFSRIEAIGKNLFAFFSAVGAPDVVMHVHFGMSGRWSVADAARAPEPTATTRLTLEGHGLVSHLSAMTVDHGGPELFEKKRRALGHDPLRSDANPEALWRKVSSSSKSIGLLLMDQSAFAGVGNIFRCEILHVARVHPEIKGDQLTRAQFDAIWDASVRLMRNAFTLGSIVTVFPQEGAALGRPTLRRWIYNSAHCGRCHGPVRSWTIQARTCYACARCQPRPVGDGAQDDAPDGLVHGSEGPTTARTTTASTTAPTLFHSHCAEESLEERLRTPQKLRVAELRTALEAAGLPIDGRKATLVERLMSHQIQRPLPALPAPSWAPAPVRMRSARAAAADKAAVGESRAVEHIAEDEELLADGGLSEWVPLPNMEPLPNLDADRLVDQRDLDPPEEEMHISPPSSRRTPKKRAPSWAPAASLPGTGQLTGQATPGAEGEDAVPGTTRNMGRKRSKTSA